MSAKNANGKRTSPAVNLIAGGGAGMMEALVCHPLDTIKVRMQLSRRATAPGAKPRGFVATGAQIVKKETALGLYKGLGAVLGGIIPKMAIRFTSYEAYKSALADPTTGQVTSKATFLAGLAAGVTEAVAVVNPMEVVKIRLQAQHHSLADPLDAPKYRSAPHALFTVIKEEGFRVLYRGVSLTALRQGTNQAANFTAYTELKAALQRWQPEYSNSQLPSYQTTFIGLISGAVGPFSNAPIDTIKTRLQKTRAEPGQSAVSRIMVIAKDMFKTEGTRAFYKGITPRVMRVAPGQAVTFTVYEYLKGKLEASNWAFVGGKFEDPSFTAPPHTVNNQLPCISQCGIMQSGITVSSELQDAFARFNSDTSTFCLPVTITAETLTPLTPISFQGTPSADSFFSALPQLSSVLQPKTPIYLLIRRTKSSSTSLIALTYIPSNAPVRAKTLFASTRSTLTRELGTEKFASTVFATEEDEVLGQDAWRERDGEGPNAISREDMMGEKERELEAVRKAEAEARSGTPGRDIGIGGTFGPGSGSGMRVSMPVDEAAKTALRDLQDGGLVQLTIDIPTEKIILADSKTSVEASAVASHISSSSPRYTFYHYPGSDVVVFVYTCPSGSSIKERMLHASSRRNAITVAEQEGHKILKKIEASGPDEITDERLQEEVNPPRDQGPARGFARPRRPGR
ncbi:unnamed protein product [Penicillium olsonii]|uniref:Twinfilin n=1 Tax=Penicillium olsonii TaxID=99116 RepID=A0A9W4HNC0_PENOL|nr:unnamed protein product [Penicillium olsonii]CAG8067665.1 unnamed protein product [Penicillium olsonii]